MSLYFIVFLFFLFFYAAFFEMVHWNNSNAETFRFRENGNEFRNESNNYVGGNMSGNLTKKLKAQELHPEKKKCVWSWFLSTNTPHEWQTQEGPPKPNLNPITPSHPTYPLNWIPTQFEPILSSSHCWIKIHAKLPPFLPLTFDPKKGWHLKFNWPKFF